MGSTAKQISPVWTASLVAISAAMRCRASVGNSRLAEGANRCLSTLIIRPRLPAAGGATAPEIAAAVSAQYRPEGRRAFDAWFMGDKVYGTPLVIESRAAADMPEARENAMPLGRHLDGCRIGFDLGGSDRKAAAVIDGKVVFSEEIRWDPYFQKDPTYHIEGVHDSLQRAAAHLPRVDAIGGSSAGIIVADSPAGLGEAVLKAIKG